VSLALRDGQRQVNQRIGKSIAETIPVLRREIRLVAVPLSLSVIERFLNWGALRDRIFDGGRQTLVDSGAFV